MITYRFNDQGKKVKTTRRIRSTIVKEQVNPRVAERKGWAKFGAEKDNAPGPDLSTTTVGENIIFRPSLNWASSQKEEPTAEEALKGQLKDKKVACRICKGDHFTARCPFKDTMAPINEGAGGDDSRPTSPDGAGGLGGGAGAGGSYVPPQLRGGKSKDSGSGAYPGRERDDLATLRVTNLSEFAEESELREMFERYGRVTRVFLAKDRETGRAKGFAFVSYQDRTDAQKACEKMDGCKFDICPTLDSLLRFIQV